VRFLANAPERDKVEVPHLAKQLDPEKGGTRFACTRRDNPSAHGLLPQFFHRLAGKTSA
jgi:hypothetical protein